MYEVNNIYKMIKLCLVKFKKSMIEYKNKYFRLLEKLDLYYIKNVSLIRRRYYFL